MVNRPPTKTNSTGSGMASTMASQDVRDDIYIRPYRDSDFEEIIKLFLVHMYEYDAPYPRIMRSQFTAPLSIFAYSLIIAGIASSYTFSKSTPLHRISAGAISLLGLSIFSYHRHALRASNEGFVQYCLKDDLADIGKHYGIDSKTNLGAIGKSGFWVAEELKEDGKHAEIVGFIGLDASTNSDPAVAEIRRMTVSSNHRRRGIARKLIQAVFDHARKNEVKSIVLGTTAYNVSAINVYKKLGFSVVGVEDIPMEFQAPIQRYLFRLDL